MLIIAPHSGNGGWAPSPRKPRLAAPRMAIPMSMLALTMMGEVQFGRMWTKTTRRFPAPMERAAST